MSDKTAKVTPMMAQFLDIKEGYPDALLFYRMGDFYELFFDDAIAAAEALDIALTKRGKHLGKDIPMCGVPVHSAEGYLLTLIRKGFRVAVCEQLENPAEAKKRGAKSVVKRDVVRLVTPGTLTEESLLDARRHNFLAAFAEIREEGAIAWVDISTGAFRVMPCSRMRLSPELARLAPREVILPDQILYDLDGIVTESGAAPTPLGQAAFDSAGAEKRLKELYAVGSLEAFGSFTRVEIAAMGAIVEYLEITQKGKLPLLRPPVRELSHGTLQIDAATRRNLELTHAMSGGRQGSLLSVVDRTVTAGGGRLLERRISSPSRNLSEIHARLETVSFLVEQSRISEDLRESLRKTPDMDRALSRLGLDRGGPRDLAAIRGGLGAAIDLSEQLANAEAIPERLMLAGEKLLGHDTLLSLLEEALVADPPLLARDGGFIAPGYDEDLDEARKLRDEGRGVIAGMQAEYAQIAGVSSLKIKHNNVLGYFIETTATHADKMLNPPLSETFIHRQTTANAVRFTTVALSELETKIHNAGSRALEIEKRLYSSLTREVLDRAAAIADTARALAEIDLATGFADLARAEGWAMPHVDESRKFEITGGRHPVVEAALRKTGEPFIANDCSLSNGNDHAHIWLLTGPNMAGKSTFLRQNALIALLAQTGSFVPAKSAHIGIVSQLFSRVGASDDLARGRSTFMVEMVETAAILNQADDRALVILDEIGRGTATYDGLSIAWATLEHLHETNRSRALFATHYHEMTQLADKLTGVENATISVKEWEGEVIFLHEVKKGAADRSYGVQVAKLAGLPEAVIARANVVLEALEKGERDGEGAKAMIDDLPLFAATPPAPAPVKTAPSRVEDALREVLPDSLTPREALNLVYDLRELLKD
ncbi:DNA mismatch repair protein MutS [Aliiroseovarius sp. xm-m-379]|nr:DNA mismatch repair protein MutS [Aliiroseovarius sp. xm-m-379]NRP34833.1 DNA mismatch repair protein MutS [Aliiroseovarius sp. xm-a-104]NRP42887.1 DNA mismatch repair protein MutS [Aliiroseovarius sp. xm-m-378]NRP49959.1 DNA mismatch repair protein MutS [Aliiroseovarius sp. xm-m-354]NRP63758.1 DNA mismatch repair protein MutS [Aliiroseovarius sp. xm-v-225]NRP90819.1 DNA mismatch repair protein MutS [Aliiroseovarius sp. xm-a-134]NRQ04713.1 DNA mismatch repair protein MutS [Aliiroseovarius 